MSVEKFGLRRGDGGRKSLHVDRCLGSGSLEAKPYVSDE